MYVLVNPDFSNMNMNMNMSNFVLKINLISNYSRNFPSVLSISQGTPVGTRYRSLFSILFLSPFKRLHLHFQDLKIWQLV